MKKSFSGLGRRVSLLIASAAAAIGVTPKPKAFNAPEANPIKRSGKSSGGSSKGSVSRDRPYRSWRAVFGGIAGASYGFIDLATPSLKTHWSSACGPRPNTWYKTLRLRTAAA